MANIITVATFILVMKFTTTH